MEEASHSQVAVDFAPEFSHDDGCRTFSWSAWDVYCCARQQFQWMQQQQHQMQQLQQNEAWAFWYYGQVWATVWLTIAAGEQWQYLNPSLQVPPLYRVDSPSADAVLATAPIAPPPGLEPPDGENDSPNSVPMLTEQEINDKLEELRGRHYRLVKSMIGECYLHTADMQKLYSICKSDFQKYIEDAEWFIDIDGEISAVVNAMRRMKDAKVVCCSRRYYAMATRLRKLEHATRDLFTVRTQMKLGARNWSKKEFIRTQQGAYGSEDISSDTTNAAKEKKAQLQQSYGKIIRYHFPAYAFPSENKIENDRRGRRRPRREREKKKADVCAQRSFKAVSSFASVSLEVIRWCCDGSILTVSSDSSTTWSVMARDLALCRQAWSEME